MEDGTGKLAVPAGLCESCRHRRLVPSMRGTYLRCERSRIDPDFPRYPRLPVESCRGYEERGVEPEDQPERSRNR